MAVPGRPFKKCSTVDTVRCCWICLYFVIFFLQSSDAFSTKSANQHNWIARFRSDAGCKTFVQPLRTGNPYSIKRSRGVFNDHNWCTFSRTLTANTAKAKISSSSSCLFMYNLPGGGGGGRNELGNIVKGAVSIVLVIAFFASPLGGLFLGLFNSFLVLLFILPIIASVGFQIWQSLNTITGTCPNCGAPATVLKSNKDGFGQPSLCFNCGAVLQANGDNTKIENISGRTTIDELNTPGNSIFDMLTGRTTTSTTTTTTTTRSGNGRDKIRRETTVIDVDVEDEDKPFQ